MVLDIVAFFCKHGDEHSVPKKRNFFWRGGGMEKDPVSWKEYVTYIAIYRRTKIDLEFYS